MDKDTTVYGLRVVVAVAWLFIYIVGCIALWQHDYLKAAALFSFLVATKGA